jgi:hypothetical protein
MSERWLPVVGFEGRYEVSNLGRVRSHFRGGRMLKPYINVPRGGYRYVNLHDEQGQHMRRVARLVAAAFHGEPAAGQVVRHLDNCRTNDVPENLAWGSAKDNSADMVRHGTNPAGERHPMARLSRDDVVAIRASAAGRRELASTYAVDARHIDSIRSGRRW